MSDVFGNNLRHFRMAQGITASDLAVSIGVSASTIHAYEKGKAHPTVGNLCLISEVLSVTTDMLLGFPVYRPATRHMTIEDKQKFLLRLLDAENMKCMLML